MFRRQHDFRTTSVRGRRSYAGTGLGLLILAGSCVWIESSSEAQMLSPSNITFTAASGAGAPPTQTIKLNPVPTERTRTWTVSKSSNWLQVSPTTGSIRNDTDQLTVSVNTSGMNQGINTDTILITLVDPGGVVRTTSTLVTLNLTSGTSTPSIALSPTTVSFSGSAGGSAPPAKPIGLTNPGGGRLSWSIGSSVPWLVVSPVTGSTRTETDTITITANTAGLAAGTYAGVLTISGDGANSPQQIMVNLTLSGQAGQTPVLNVSPANLSVSTPQGTKGPLTYKINITNTGGGDGLSWTVTDPVDWLIKNVDSGVTPGTLEVYLYPDGLPQGTYQTTVTVKSAGVTGSSMVIPVTMSVTGSTQTQSQTPNLSVAPTSLSVSAPLGSRGPLAYYINISNSGGGGSLQWSVTDPVDWLWKSVDYGMTPETLEVYLYPDGLPAGTYTTNVTATIPGATNSPRVIPVTMTVGATTSASATLSWNSNAESDLAGYKIHYGTASRAYDASVNVGNVTTYTVNGLTTGRTYYFAVSALDQTGNESGLSMERTVTR